MGLQSALTTALTGLQAAETSIDVVGNNVANSNTVGFKESDVVFATQFLQTQSIGSAPTDSRGGTNPRQIGLGAKVAEISPNFTQGTIEISSNPLDVAIQGDGFLVVQDLTGGRLYTRNGQLKLNANNEIVTATGNRVLGYGVDDDFNLVESSFVPISIPLGQERVAQETGSARMSGVLNPAADAATQPGIIRSSTLGNAQIPRPDDTSFTIADVATSEPPEATTAAANAGSGTGPSAGVVRYRVAFLDANGREGAPATEFSITATGNSINLSTLPTADGTTYVDRVIYRTTAGGSSFFRVGAVGNATTTTFTDTVTDATLTTNPAFNSSVIDPGSYSYYVTYYDPSNPDIETRPTNRIGPVSLSATGRRIRLDLSDIPALGTGFTNYTQMRIYRNVAGSSSDFRLVSTVPSPGQPGYLDSYIDSATSASIASAASLDLDGPRANAGTLLTDVIIRSGSGYEDVFEQGTLNFTGELGGSRLTQKSLTIGATTTVQELIDFMTDALGIHEVSGDPNVPLPSGGGEITIEDGRIRVVSNYGEENSISIPLTAFQLTPTGSSVSQPASIPFSEVQTANGPGTTTEMIVYDSLGSPISVKLTTVLETSTSNSTTYRWYATSGQAEPSDGQSISVGNGVLVFDSNGDLVPGSDSRIAIPREMTASNSPVEVELDFSNVSSLVETNAQNDLVSSLNMTSQDGFPPGVLTDFIVTESGRIQGQFSNGTQRDLGQLVLARFANNGGLQQVGDSLFNIGVNSGSPVFGEPGEDGIGSLTAGAVELSNTDIGQNLIELILASTQYRGGARVITTAQELLDELLALRR